MGGWAMEGGRRGEMVDEDGCFGWRLVMVEEVK